MVTTVPTSTTITITMDSAEAGSGATTSGGIRVQYYYPVGPAQQLGAYRLGDWSMEWYGFRRSLYDFGWSHYRCCCNQRHYFNR